MERLVNKTISAYDYNSRYNTVPYYYNIDDEKYIRGLSKSVVGPFEYSIHMVKTTDTLDKLALYYYGDPSKYWILAEVNGILDPFIQLSSMYNFIYIPAYKDIRLE